MANSALLLLLCLVFPSQELLLLGFLGIKPNLPCFCHVFHYAVQTDPAYLAVLRMMPSLPNLFHGVLANVAPAGKEIPLDQLPHDYSPIR